jgi:hypothetical protein
LIVIRTGQRTGSRRTKNRCQVVIAEPDDDQTVVVGGSLRDRVAIRKLQAALLNAFESIAHIGTRDEQQG